MPARLFNPVGHGFEPRHAHHDIRALAPRIALIRSDEVMDSLSNFPESVAAAAPLILAIAAIVGAGAWLLRAAMRKRR